MNIYMPNPQHRTMLLDENFQLTLSDEVCDALCIKAGDEIDYISQNDGTCLMVRVGWQPNEPAILLSARKK